MKTVLLVDDDEDFAFALRRALALHGIEVEHAARGSQALRMFARGRFLCTFIDLGLPDMSGHELVELWGRSEPLEHTVVLTGRDDVADVVRALRAGAFHYLAKPLDSAAILGVLEQVRARVRSRQGSAQPKLSDAELIGAHPAWRAVMDQLQRAAESTTLPVLIIGESGTGKERSARLVHDLSPRARAPFVAVSAADFSQNLLESELFGHEAGAFSGAVARRRGVFELADRGTLFLDEIGELPLDLQPKLLRVLETGRFRRLGSEKELACEVRIVAATNRVLRREVQEGRFRADLYHRISALELELPPLRERASDIPELATTFIREFASRLGRDVPTLSPAADAALASYSWPGNVRELRNVIERAVLFTTGAQIGVDVMPAVCGPPDEVAAPAPPMSFPQASHAGDGRFATLREAMHAHALLVYEALGRNLSRAAEVLDVSRATLRRYLNDGATLRQSDFSEDIPEAEETPQTPPPERALR